MALTIDREISYAKQIPVVGHFLANGLQRVQDAINQLGTHTGTDPTGILPAPPPIQKLDVKAANGLVHAVITDSSPNSKPLHNFIEYDTSPNFSQPHVIHLGASRSMPPMTLPALNDSSAPQSWHFRAYSQYPGSQPGKKVNFGGETPTPVSVGGTQAMTLLASTGSGTASPDGQQGGSGFGKTLTRQPSGR
jgi:hypothetical protein